MPDPPAELTSCAAAPAISDNPSGPDVGIFIRQLDAAGEDCRKTLRDLTEWLDDAARRFAP